MAAAFGALCDDHIANPKKFKDALFPSSGVNPLMLDEAAHVIGLELAKNDKSIHEEISSLISKVKLAGNYKNTNKFLDERPVRVVTTNYDKLLEEIVGRDCLTISPGRPVPRSDARVKVYHVHGSVDVPGKMIVTADDYFNFMHSESYFSRKLSTALHENTVVILGYSLGDTNLKSILNDYRGFVRNHAVSNSIFLVSRSSVDQRVSDYYSNCYGIRVISNTEVEEFFGKVNMELDEAREVSKSVDVIKKILYENNVFTEKYLQVETSFYEIVSAIWAVGENLQHERVVKTFADVIAKKMKLAQAPNAWEQYVQLATWLTYLGSLIDVRGTAVEDTYLAAVKWSMEHMSRTQTLGYSWHAYKVWDARWNSVTLDNRSLISKHIKLNSNDRDAIEITSRN